MSTGRFITFLATVLAIWAVMHAYVFWRLASIPWVSAHFSRRAIIVAAVALWLSYPLARILDSWNVGLVTYPLEYFAANWIGFIFLFVAGFLVADVLTLGGWAMSKWVGTVRGSAAILSTVLGLVAVGQALRGPVVRHQEVVLPHLPRERDGMVLVHISDLHLGTLLGESWLRRLVKTVAEQKPDLLAVVGDVVDGNVPRVEPMAELLQQLRAPLGVVVVTGNHEFYAGADASVRLFERAGWKVLRDEAAEIVPGLVLAGVDDLTAREQFGQTGDPVKTTLEKRPGGATILLSHSPWKAEVAAAAGAGLMLSGHTHNGQIWPFNYLVQTRYQLMGGRYTVDGMPVIVCRGTGTWGPRMRLWHPSEIIRITLRAG